MGSKSNYLENKVLDAAISNQAFPSNATIYIALFTAAPNDAGGGTEVTGGSYVRKALTANLTNFSAASSGQKKNAVSFSFVTATANWGTITHWAIFDASSGGNMLYWGEVSPSVVINNGDTFQVAVNGMTVSED